MTPEKRAKDVLAEVDLCNPDSAEQCAECVAAVVKVITDAEAAVRERCAAHAWHAMQHAFVPEDAMKEVDAAIRQPPAESEVPGCS